MHSPLHSPVPLEPAPGARLYWMRENTPGGLDYDLGVPLPPILPRLPVLLAERIREALHRHPGITEIHLPYIRRRDWPARFEMLNDTRFEARGAQLLPERYCGSAAELNLYQARLLAVSAFQDGAEAGNWREAPRPGQAFHFAAYAPVSLAVQKSLRQAIASRWMEHVNRVSCFDEVCAILGYLASPPYHPRTLTEFTYDVRNAHWFHSAFRLARKPLTQLLLAWRAHLLARGRPDLAAAYDPDKPALILDQIRRSPRRAKSIFANEEAIVNLIVSFGSAISVAAGPFEAVHAVTPILRDLEIHLRRLTPGLDLTAAAAGLLLDATAAIRPSPRRIFSG